MKRFGSFSLIFLLILELFSPLAFAQNATTPSPQPFSVTVLNTTGTITPLPFANTPVSPSCQLSSFDSLQSTLGVANPTKNFWDNTLGLNANSINEKSNLELQFGARNFTTQPAPEQFFTVNEIAGVLGKDPNDVRNELGITENATTETITTAQMKQIASSHPGGLIEQFLGIKQVAPLQKEDYLMVQMPNGKKVRLSEVQSALDYGDQVKSSCTLDNAAISGETSFMALLDKDLRIGSAQSTDVLNNVNLKRQGGVAGLSILDQGYPDAPQVDQHLATTTAAHSVNYGDSGGTFVLGKLYEKFIRETGTWNFYDLAFTATLSVAASAGQKEAKELVEGAEKSRASTIEELDKIRPQITAQNQAAQLKDAISKESNSVVFHKEIPDPLGHAPGSAGYVRTVEPITYKQSAGEIDQILITKNVAVVDDAGNPVKSATTGAPLTINLGKAPSKPSVSFSDSSNDWKEYYAKLKTYYRERENTMKEILTPANTNYKPYFGGPAGDFLKYDKAEESSLTGEVSYVEKKIGELEAAKTKIKDAKNALKAAEKTEALVWNGPMRSLWIGGGWLLPARLALHLSTKAILDQKQKDAYIDIYVNRQNVLKSFRDVTSFFGLAKIADIVTGSFGAEILPEKTFNFGNVVLLDRPWVEESRTSTATSITSVKNNQITVNWKGDSEATTFEDLRQVHDTTSLGVYSKDMNFGSGVPYRDKAFDAYFTGLMATAPLALFGIKLAKVPGLTSGIARAALFLTISDYYSQLVSPAEFNAKCDASKIEGYINGYKSTVVLDIVSSGLTYAVGKSILGVAMKGIYDGKDALSKDVASTYPKLSKAIGGNVPGPRSEGALKALAITDPVGIAQFYFLSTGQEYATACQDSDYYILSYQKIPGAPGGLSAKKAIDQALKPLTEALGGLSISNQTNQTAGQKVSDDDLKEMLNMRSALKDQTGVLKPDQVFYLHLQNANLQWYGATQKSCLRTVMEGTDRAAIIDSTGISVLNKTTGQSVQIADPLRAILSQLNQELGRTIVPNKIISTDMDSNDQIFTITKDQKLFAQNTPIANCIKQKVAQIINSNLTSNDLTGIFGKVLSVYTNKGQVGFTNNAIAFLNNDGTQKILAEDSDHIELFGNANVLLKDSETINAGKMLTVITEHGRFEYDPSTGKLYVALYILAEVPGDAIKSLGISPGKVFSPDCNKQTPAINFGPLVPQIGAEEKVKQMQNSLLGVQKDSQGNPGGMQVLETGDHIYYFTYNQNCDPILRIFDKKTGQWTDYKITGSLSQDENGNIVVPTDKGIFKFGLNTQNGVPMLSVNGPGLSELLPLLAARGPGGMFAFDPFTKRWFVFNGQDIPWNPDFINKGLAFQGSQNGLQGLPANDVLKKSGTSSGDTSGINPLLALPLSPTDPLLLGAFVAFIVLGVIYIRRRIDSSP